MRSRNKIPYFRKAVLTAFIFLYFCWPGDVFGQAKIVGGIEVILTEI
ncbi:hypothetical protein [Leptolyngbya sp. 7M]|nr:hypothetical protein [Leptolyngbya sp. 7M]QYO67321.1 hypothetical protein JVX88_11250 [Leptolyngbya sp. 7M]